jgi:GNAT superfamily N-acetyltransferase
MAVFGFGAEFCPRAISARCEDMTVVPTRTLDETVRLAEITGIRAGIDAVRRLYPEANASSMDVAGGLAVFTGVESPLSQTYGMVGPVGRDDIGAITAFYASRGGTARVVVSPTADASLGRGLAAAGYQPCEYESVLICDSFDGRPNDRIVVTADLAKWARASAQGFMEIDSLKPGDDRIAIVLASSEGVVPLEVHEGDAIAATAAMDVRDGCAALFAGSTLPQFRGRGWHTALIRDRIARASAAGARMMRATARPGSISERNFHRCGFNTLYTRTVWERQPL